MSKKNKRDRSRRIEIDHLQIARRELGKRNAKLALEHARLHHEKSPDAESREVLERALLARAEQTFAQGNRDAAKGLLDELDALGGTVAEVAAAQQRLRVLMGIASPHGQAATGGPLEPPEDLAALLADQAVVFPPRRSPAYPDLNAQADLVREALREVERGEDAMAVERLAGIPRKSPFAEWRLFVRGLVAHYADDAERVEANWGRLDPQRAASRIAKNVLVFSGRLKAEDCPVDVATGQRRLRYAVSDNPLVERLERMRDSFQSGRVHEALSELRTLRQRYGQSRESLLERLSDVMWKRLVAAGDERGVRQLIRTIPGPPLDPHWHRARALLWQQSDSPDLNQVEEHWTAYVGDLRKCSALSEDERKAAIALVLRRLADLFAEAAHHESLRDVSRSDFWDDEEFDEYELDPEEMVRLLRTQAEKHLRDAVRECPLLLDAHRDLVALFQDDDQPEKAVEAARHLLESFPEHFETLLWLANYYIEADRPADAELYAQRVARLRPRDPAVQNLLWHQRIGMVRQLTRKRKFDQARHQLEEAFAVKPPGVKPYTKELLLATIEYKAKDQPAAEAHLQTALTHFREPTAIWMMMHAYADRFGLSREVKNGFRDRFKATIHKRYDSQTAGHCAAFLHEFVSRRVKYTGLATHQRLLVDRLLRPASVDWQHEDLRSVCEFLQANDAWRTNQLRLHLLKEGLRRFPGDPLFPYLYAVNMMKQGPYRMNVQAVVDHYELALKLNETAEFRLSETAIDRAKAGLSAALMARDMLSSMMERFAGFMGGIHPEDMEDLLEDDDDMEDWEDEYEDEYDGPHGRSGSPHWTSGRRAQTGPSDEGKSQRFFPF